VTAAPLPRPVLLPTATFDEIAKALPQRVVVKDGVMSLDFGEVRFFRTPAPLFTS
jgi:hypothetical protein